jgi:hypothetical protein
MTYVTIGEKREAEAGGNTSSTCSTATAYSYAAKSSSHPTQKLITCCGSEEAIDVEMVPICLPLLDGGRPYPVVLPGITRRGRRLGLP